MLYFYFWLKLLKPKPEVQARSLKHEDSELLTRVGASGGWIPQRDVCGRRDRPRQPPNVTLKNQCISFQTVYYSLPSLSFSLSLSLCRPPLLPLFFLLSSRRRSARLSTAFLHPFCSIFAAVLQPFYSLCTASRQLVHSLSTAFLQPGYSLSTAFLQPGYSLLATFLQPFCSLGAASLQPWWSLGTAFLQPFYSLGAAFLHFSGSGASLCAL